MLIQLVESKIREDYLIVAQEEQDLVRELSTPPDSDADGITIIQWYQSSWKDGVETLTFTIESRHGEQFICSAEDLKVDAPKLFATYILSKPRFRKHHGDLHKWAESMRVKAAKAALILSAHKRGFGIGPCLENPIAPSYTICKIRHMATTKSKRPSKNQRPLEPSNEFLYGIRIPRMVEEAI
jgi:hypothetical protein